MGKKPVIAKAAAILIWGLFFSGLYLVGLYSYPLFHGLAALAAVVVGCGIFITAFYLIYQAIVRTGLRKPYNLLFESLKQSEAMLREEKNRAQRYLDVAGVMLVAVNIHKRVALINKKGCEILKTSEKDILGQNWFEKFVPAGSRAGAIEDFEKIMAGQTAPADYFISPVIDSEQAERIIAWHNSILTDAGGNIVGVLCSGEDVTERQRMEQALRESEEKFRAITGTAKDAIIAMDNARRISYWNPAAAELFGYNDQEVLGKEVHLILGPENNYGAINGADGQDMKSPPAADRTRELMAVKKDGTEFPIELSVSAIQIKGNWHSVGIIRDITNRKKRDKELKEHREKLEELIEERTAKLSKTNTELQHEIVERKRTEVALRKSEKKFKRLSHEFNILLDAIPDTLLLLSEDLRVRWANRGAAATIGLDIAQLSGRYCYELMNDRPTPCPECSARKSFASGQAENGQYANAHGKLMETRSFPIKDEKGKVVNVIMVAIDITEKAALQTEALRSRHLSSLGELAAGVAHEINNPINGIINYGQLIVNMSPADSRQYDIAKRIIKEGDRIAIIVRSLLSFARARKEEKKPVHLSGIMADCLALTGAQLLKDGIKLNVDIPAAAPKILASPPQITQVLLNIIINARYALNQKYPKAHDPKSIDITARAITADDRRYVRLLFHDNGTGIPAGIINNIMDPFYSTKPADKGTGLGLSISHGIISDHDGKLMIESVEGEYTRVIIDLPCEGETAK